MSPIRELRAAIDALNKWQGYPPNVTSVADKIAWLISLLRISLKRLQREEKDGKRFRWADETVVESIHPTE